MTIHRSTWLRAALALLMALLVAAPAGAAQSEAAVWSRVAGADPAVFYEDVFMLGRELAWVAGRSSDDTKGYVYRMRLAGGRWTVELDASFPAGVYALAALDAERVWAVGAGGLIARRDASGWRTVASPAPDATLRAIQLLGDGSAGWAAGSRQSGDKTAAVMLRLRGGAWEQARIDASPDFSYVNALHLAPGGGWAVGTNLWRLRGDEWQREPEPASCDVFCAAWFNAVRAIDGERAIAVGGRSGNCGICTSKFLVAERDRGGWRTPFRDGWPAEVMPPPPAYPDTHSLGALYMLDGGSGLAVGSRYYPTTPGGPYTAEIFGLRYSGGSWRYELILPGAGNAISGLFMADSGHALLVGGDGLLASYGYGDQSAPISDPRRPVANPGQPGVAYFPETGHTLRGAFRSYWERYGGLAQFGYPLTEEYVELSETDGKPYTVQYFERARFEHHPENAGTPYEVLLGLLGHTVTAGRKGESPFLPAGPSGQPGAIYFPETGHNMAPQFVDYWRRNGGLAIYGYPISEPFYEVNAADGRSYLVQYFERNRFEHHPENAGTPYEVLLGLLGSEVLSSKAGPMR